LHWQIEGQLKNFCTFTNDNTPIIQPAFFVEFSCYPAHKSGRSRPTVDAFGCSCGVIAENGRTTSVACRYIA